MIVEKKITELLPGHYVVDIVEQHGSFQLRSQGHIKNEGVIRHLTAKGVVSLLIDIDKSLTPAHTKENGEIVFTKAPKEKIHKQPLILEISKAKQIFSQSKQVQKKVIEDIINDSEIDVGPIKDVTNDSIEAIFKNPDALACILNIRHKDEYLLEHSVSVSILLAIFAKHLEIKRPIIEEICIGAFLHDVGKIKIPDNILNKPSRLSDDEFTIMKSHANHSIDIISNAEGISDLSLEVAALHHEKLNGSGYPYGLTASEISQYGRMITICDIFDALTADRVYKEGYCHVKAFNILRKLAEQGELDTTLVDQFIRCMGVYPVGSLVELSSHRLAIVEQRNFNDPIRPKVRSFYDVDYRHYTMTEDIDLSTNDDFIVKSVRANEFNLDMNRIVEFLMMQG